MRWPVVVVAFACCCSLACEISPHQFGAGYDARDYVSGESYRALLIEVDAVSGKAGDPEVYVRVHEALDDLRRKGSLAKDVIEFRDDDLDADRLGGGEEDNKHDLAELRAAQDAVIDGDGAPAVAVIRVLWVDGGYVEDRGVNRTLGLSYGGDRVVMFPDSIAKSCRLHPELCLETTATVMLHELGHLFGLVGNGAPLMTEHQDVAHGHHDVNPDCIMYFSTEGSDVVDVLADRAVGGLQNSFSFDDACLDDLRGLIEH